MSRNWMLLSEDKKQDKDLLFSPLLFNIVLEILTSTRKQEKLIKDMQIGKEEIKLFFTNDIFYIEIPKDSIKKTNRFNEVV